MALQTYIFIGRSGCGKGTQVELLIEHLKQKGIINEQNPLLYLETGDKFRDLIKGTGHTSRLSRVIMESSARQPDFLAVWIWSHILVENIMGEEHLILDGTPRSLIESQVLDTAMKFYDRKNVNVIYLDISREEAKKRLEERGRMDDKKAGDIDTRLDWFDKDVLPAVEFFKEHPEYNFIQINGEQAREKIHKDIVAALGQQA